MPLARASNPHCRAAQAFAQRLAPLVAELQATGIHNREAIAREMMARGIPAPGGGQRWRSGTVTRLLRRVGGGGGPPPKVPAVVKLATSRPKRSPIPARWAKLILAAVVDTLKAHDVTPPEGFAQWNAAALDAAKARRRRRRKHVPVGTVCC